MKLQLTDYDREFSASNLRQDGEALKWDSRRGTVFLLMRTGYGRGVELTEKLVADFEKVLPETMRYKTDFSCGADCSFTILSQGYSKVFPIVVKPAHYAMFSCTYNEDTDTLNVILPSSSSRNQCDVAASISVKTVPEEQPKRKRFSRIEEKQSYSLQIPHIPGYVDGDLYYTFDGCRYRYPITQKMLGRAVSIPAYQSRRPIVSASVENGYKIAQ